MRRARSSEGRHITPSQQPSSTSTLPARPPTPAANPDGRLRSTAGASPSAIKCNLPLPHRSTVSSSTSQSVRRLPLSRYIIVYIVYSSLSRQCRRHYHLNLQCHHCGRLVRDGTHHCRTVLYRTVLTRGGGCVCLLACLPLYCAVLLSVATATTTSTGRKHLRRKSTAHPSSMPLEDGWVRFSPCFSLTSSDNGAKCFVFDPSLSWQRIVFHLSIETSGADFRRRGQPAAAAGAEAARRSHPRIEPNLLDSTSSSYR